MLRKTVPAIIELVANLFGGAQQAQDEAQQRGMDGA
jgi:hypothetical protein